MQQFEGETGIEVAYYSYIIDHGTAPQGERGVGRARRTCLVLVAGCRDAHTMCRSLAAAALEFYVKPDWSPSLPPTHPGEEYLAYNVRRWGSDGWCAGLRRSGLPDGAAFSDWRWWPDSMRAHQLLLLAQDQGKGRQAKEALLRATCECCGRDEAWA